MLEKLKQRWNIKSNFQVIVILSVYNALLLLTGAIFGQFRFVPGFEKKFFSRLFFLKKQVSVKEITV